MSEEVSKSKQFNLFVPFAPDLYHPCKYPNNNKTQNFMLRWKQIMESKGFLLLLQIS